MPFDVPCQICGATLRRPRNPDHPAGRLRAVCPGTCLSELRSRTGKRLAADGKTPKITPEIQRLAALGRTGKGKGWVNGGYRIVRDKGRNMLEHRLVMERHLGRVLTATEVVHHVNHDTLDNRIENLRLCKNRREHFQEDHPELMEKRLSLYHDADCAECGVTFRTPNGAGRQTLCRKHRRYGRR